MSSKSKTKGRAFEYKVRDVFTETFTTQFERVPLSGALDYLKGDVYPPWAPDFPWCIEAKHHKEVNWNNILTAKTNLLLSFWTQTVREATQMKKLPLLVYKWDRSDLFVCWNDDLVSVENYLKVKIDEHEFNMCLLKDWAERAKSAYTVK